jgi:NAD(P)H-dependent FMN reductase
MNVRILLISGSTRSGSTNTAALRTMAGLAGPGVTALLWDRLVEVPAFVPDADADADADAVVADLRREVAAADAVVFCTPEYAGTLPGSLKNALDWLVGSGELYRKPVGRLTVAAPARGSGAEATLATVLGYVDAVLVEGGAARIPVGRADVVDGVVTDAEVAQQLAGYLATVARAVSSAPA